MMKKNTATTISRILKVSPARGLEAEIKAQLILAINKALEEKTLTHVELAQRAKLSRSTVTGILSGSLQKVTVDRILRLVHAVGMTAELKLKKIS